MLGCDVVVPLGQVSAIELFFEGQQAFSDLIRRQELCISSEPVHPIHFVFESCVTRPYLLHHVGGMLVNESLDKAPQLVDLFNQQVDL